MKKFKDLPNENPVATAVYFRLSEEEISKLIPLALSGDGQSAFRLYQHYQYGGADDYKRASLYLITAACFGHSISQYNLGQQLINPTDEAFGRDLIAGRYWLQRSKEGGP